MKSYHNEVRAGVTEDLMKTLTIRNIPEGLYQSIRRLAERERRSIQQQVLVMLDRGRVMDQESPLDIAKALRGSLAGRDLGDTVAEVRAERDR